MSGVVLRLDTKRLCPIRVVIACHLIWPVLFVPVVWAVEKRGNQTVDRMPHHREVLALPPEFFHWVPSVGGIGVQWGTGYDVGERKKHGSGQRHDVHDVGSTWLSTKGSSLLPQSEDFDEELLYFPHSCCSLYPDVYPRANRVEQYSQI